MGRVERLKKLLKRKPKICNKLDVRELTVHEELEQMVERMKHLLGPTVVKDKNGTRVFGNKDDKPFWIDKPNQ